MGTQLNQRKNLIDAGSIGLTMSRAMGVTNFFSGKTNNFLIKPMRPIDLGALKIDEKRDMSRIPTKGVVIIHDLFRKKQFKVRIRNFSVGGLCCEIEGSGSTSLGSEVMVEFVGTISKAGLDVVKSKVMWATPLQNCSEKKLLIGLQFSNEISATKLKKIKEFVELLISEI